MITPANDTPSPRELSLRATLERGNDVEQSFLGLALQEIYVSGAAPSLCRKFSVCDDAVDLLVRETLRITFRTLARARQYRIKFPSEVVLWGGFEVLAEIADEVSYAHNFGEDVDGLERAKLILSEPLERLSRNADFVIVDNENTNNERIS